MMFHVFEAESLKKDARGFPGEGCHAGHPVKVHQLVPFHLDQVFEQLLFNIPGDNVDDIHPRFI